MLIDRAQSMHGVGRIQQDGVESVGIERADQFSRQAGDRLIYDPSVLKDNA